MPIQADDASLSRLLELQEEDSDITRLEDRKAALPEAARLAEMNEQLEELGADIATATKNKDGFASDQSKAEGEMEILDQKIAKEEARMYGGGVSNPKELSALQAEIEMLKRKRAVLEDQVLEAMVQKDDYATTAERLTAERDSLQTEANSLSATVNEIASDIDAQLLKHRTKRSEVAATLAGELLDLYEKLREQKHGVGAAALEGGTCQGCHTQLPAREVERLKAERGLQRCDNCRRILVIT